MFYGAVLNAGEYIGKPSYRIYVPPAACSQQRIDDGRMVCRLVVAPETVVRAPPCLGPNVILRSVVVETVSAVRDITCHARIQRIGIAHSLSDGRLRHGR